MFWLLSRDCDVTKIQIFGHSFVRRLKCFIRDNSDYNFNLNRDGHPLVQYSGFPGATVTKLYNKVEHIVDFSPDLLFLVVGTNDVYDVSVSTEDVANSIFNLAEVIHRQSKTQRIVIVQVLHRHPPSVAVRYPVDVDFYNNRVDQLNKRLGDFASNMP